MMVVLLIMLHKVVFTFESVDDVVCEHCKQYFQVVLFILLYNVVLSGALVGLGHRAEPYILTCIEIGESYLSFFMAIIAAWLAGMCTVSTYVQRRVTLWPDCHLSPIVFIFIECVICSGSRDGYRENSA